MGALAKTSEEAKAVQDQLERILASPAFLAAGRRVRLLRFLVERSLAGDNGSLKESVIAVEVFDRAPDYDPKLDSLVRVEMGRLRSRLVEYYAQAGQDDPIRIEIPKGSYQPVFTFTEPLERQAPASVTAPVPRRGWKAMVAVAGSLALCLAALAIWKLGIGQPTASIAVLPFLNLSGDSANEYLSDSLADELTGVLAESKSLRVVARTSAFQFKGKSSDIRQIGKALGAGAVLEGSISKPAGQFRIVVQLIRTADGYHTWSHVYEARSDDLQRVETEIARSAIQTLIPTAAAASSQPVDLMTTANPEAHDLSLRAKYYLAVRTPEALRESVKLATQAIEKDPSYPLPYQTIGSAEWTLGTLTAEYPEVADRQALQSLDKAIALNPRYGDAHALRAGILYNLDWNWPRAEEEFRLALQLGSNSAHSLYGWALATRGRFKESQDQLRIAEELDPLGSGPLQNRATAFLAAGDYPEARRELRRWLELDPRALYALLLSAAVELNDHNCVGALADLQKTTGLYPQLPLTQGALMLTQAHCGQPEPARQFLAQVEKTGVPGVARLFIASVYAAVHDTDHALQYLRQAVDGHEALLLWLKFDANFAEMHRDPRYLELERRVMLPQ